MSCGPSVVCYGNVLRNVLPKVADFISSLFVNDCGVVEWVGIPPRLHNVVHLAVRDLRRLPFALAVRSVVGIAGQRERDEIRDHARPKFVGDELAELPRDKPEIVQKAFEEIKVADPTGGECRQEICGVIRVPKKGQEGIVHGPDLLSLIQVTVNCHTGVAQEAGIHNHMLCSLDLVLILARRILRFDGFPNFRVGFPNQKFVEEVIELGSISLVLSNGQWNEAEAGSCRGRWNLLVDV